MNILHVASLNTKKFAGPNINVPKNVIIGNNYANVGLYNISEHDILFKIPKCKYFSGKNYKKLSMLPSPFNRPDIVIFHSMYEIKFCSIAKELVKLNIPYIVVPRCSLTKAAQHSKYFKKKIGNIVFFNKFIREAQCIQFLTENEYLESKKVFKFKNYFILGNGIDLPMEFYKVKNRHDFKITFIGRLNVYHKGLDILLESIKDHLEWFKNNNIVLLLYGTNSDNGLNYLKKYINDNKLNDIVKLNGPVFDNDKKIVLLDTDLFIHTSRLEGQPTAVIEAMSYGIPVIVTPGTNVTDIVKENNLGFICNLDSKSIFNCVRLAFNSRNTFAKISQNAIEYSKKHFDWDKIIKKSINIYHNKGWCENEKKKGRNSQ